MKPDPIRQNPDIYPYVIEITTRFGDMDVNHHLNNVAYARYFEEGRVTFNRGLLIDSAGHRLPELKDFHILVAAISIAYLREGHYGPPVRIGVGISKIGNLSFGMAAACFQEGKCLAVHDSVIAGKGPATGWPDEMRARLTAKMLNI